MDKINRVDVYAAMLDEDDIEQDKKVENKPTSLPFGAKSSVPYVHDGKTYNVATSQIVNQLEATIKKQQTEIQRLDRAVKSLTQLLRNQKSYTDSAKRDMAEIRRDMENKIDRRL